MTAPSNHQKPLATNAPKHQRRWLSRVWHRLSRRQDRDLRRFDWLLPWSDATVDLASAAPTSARTSSHKSSTKRRWFRWPLTARILSINLLVLIIPLYGFVRADTYRSSLIETELASMKAEGQIVAKALGATADRLPAAFQNFRDDNFADTGGRLRQETVAQLGSGSRSTLQLLTSDIDSRMRLFDLNGELVADTRYLGAGVSPVRIEPLEQNESGRNPSFSMTQWLDQQIGGNQYQLYSEYTVDNAGNHAVTNAAYLGEPSNEVRIDEQGRLVFLAALPVQEYRRVIGTLLISRDDTGVEAAVQQLRSEVLRITFLTLGVTILLSTLLASTIARPIRRLAINAIGVARSKRRQVQIPDLRGRRDEIGDLSFATRKMTEALWDRLDATDAFAADVSHELKNPLTSLKSAVETMQTYPDSPRRGELLDIIHHDIGRMDRLITDISRSSRVDAEISRSDWQKFSLADLIEALIASRQTLDRSGAPKVEIDLSLAPGLGQDTTMVRGVADRIAQVLNNLIDNAVTFSPPGGKVLVVVSRTPNTTLRIEVVDQGPGISADRLERVFERFYTDRPESDGFGNHSGLGLSIVRQIVEGHGGRIWADNADEEEDKNDDALGFGGAKFTVELNAA